MGRSNPSARHRGNGRSRRVRPLDRQTRANRFCSRGRRGDPLADVDFDGSAKSLRGPFRGSGEASTPLGEQGPVRVRDDGDRRRHVADKGRNRLAEGRPRAAFDGKLALTATASAGSGLRPRYAGAAVFSGSLPAPEFGGPYPWKVSGALAADLDRAKLTVPSLNVGPEARALEATGEASAEFVGNPVLSANLQSKQLNLDALLRREGEEAAPPARLLSALKYLGERLTRPSSLPIQLSVTYSAPMVFLGAGSLDQLNLSASAKPGNRSPGL